MTVLFIYIKGFNLQKKLVFYTSYLFFEVFLREKNYSLNYSLHQKNKC